MSITGKIIRNVFSSWTYYFIQLAVGFFLMPFMVHRLGTDVYGIWILAFSFAAFINLFDFGIRGSIVKYVSEYEAKNDYERLTKVINTSWIIHIIVGILAILIFFILSCYLQYYFKVAPDLFNDFVICFRLIGLVIGVTIFFNIFAGILEGYKRTDIVSNIEILAFVLQSASIVFCILNGRGIVSLGVIMLVVTLLKQLARAIFSLRVAKHIRINIFLFDKNILKQILNYSIFLFAFESVLTVMNTLPSIILGIYLGAVAITFYSIAERLVGYCRIILASTSGVLVPFVSSFDAVDDKERLKKSFILGSRYSYGIFLFLGAILIVMGKPFINLWMGPEFASKCYPILVIIIMPLLFSPAFFIAPALLKGIGKLKEIAILTLFQAILSIILSMVLVKTLKLGGVALAFSIPYLLTYAIILPGFIMRILGISFKDYFYGTYSNSLISIVPIFFIMIFLKNVYYPLNYVVLVGEIALSGLLYIMISFCWVLSSHERKYYFSTIKLRLRSRI